MSDQERPIESFIKVTLSNDKLNAFIHFTNCDETFACTAAQLNELLKSHSIVYGIHYDILDKMALNTREYLLAKTLIAEGDTPIHGSDGVIQLMVDLEAEKRPVEREDGTVNYKEVTSISNVKKGQVIARKIPHREGIDGKAVTGETLPAQTGKEARFKLGKNVVADAEQTAVFATIDGVVVKTDRDKINIFPIYEVNGDVDYTIGNIDFVGSVVIRGNVLPGFHVKAAGDIRLTGGVEAAELEAGGSIEISAGILGQNKGLVRAGKSITCSFIQDGIVEAGEEVIVSQSIMHSTVRAGKSVVCQGTKGLIVGGTTQAGETVVARTIGNSMSNATIVEVGVLPELRNELLHLKSHVKSQAESLDKTEKALTLLDQLAAVGQLTPDKFAMRMKLNNTKRQASEELEHMKGRILEIEKSLEGTETAKIVVNSIIYGGTKIVIGRYVRFVKDPVSRVTFQISDGDITMSSNS